MSLRKISNRRNETKINESSIDDDRLRAYLVDIELGDNEEEYIYHMIRELPNGEVEEEDYFYGDTDVKPNVEEWIYDELVDMDEIVGYEIKKFDFIEGSRQSEVVVKLIGKDDKIVQSFDPKVIKVDYNKEYDEDYAAVLIKDKNSDWSVWMDVDLTNGSCEWNQYIFSTTDREDRLSQKLQDNIVIYDACCGVAVDYLYDKGLMKNESKKRPLRKSEKRQLTRKRIKESHCDKEQLIYDFILDNELCTEGELNMAVDVGGFNEETLNYVIYRQTAYHDIEQLWDCEKDNFYFNDDVIECFGLNDDEEDFDESKKALSRKVKRNESDFTSKLSKFQNDCYYALNNFDDIKEQMKYLKDLYPNIEIKDGCFYIKDLGTVRIR